MSIVGEGLGGGGGRGNRAAYHAVSHEGATVFDAVETEADVDQVGIWYIVSADATALTGELVGHRNELVQKDAGGSFSFRAPTENVPYFLIADTTDPDDDENFIARMIYRNGEWSRLVEGRDNTAAGDVAHVEGLGNTASGAASHAEGRRTTASGAGAHAQGLDTTANKADSAILGRRGVVGHPDTIVGFAGGAAVPTADQRAGDVDVGLRAKIKSDGTIVATSLRVSDDPASDDGELVAQEAGTLAQMPLFETVIGDDGAGVDVGERISQDKQVIFLAAGAESTGAAGDWFSLNADGLGVTVLRAGTIAVHGNVVGDGLAGNQNNRCLTALGLRRTRGAVVTDFDDADTYSRAQANAEKRTGMNQLVPVLANDVLSIVIWNAGDDNANARIRVRSGRFAFVWLGSRKGDKGDPADSTTVEEFALKASPTEKFPEGRYNLRDGQLVYGPAINFAAGAAPLGNNEWAADAGNTQAIILNFSSDDDATDFLSHYPNAAPLRVGEDEYMATVTRVMGSDTSLHVDLGVDRPDSITGSLAVRFHSELVSSDRSTTIARGAASGAVAGLNARRYPQQVVVFGRFANAALVGGVPPTAPDIIFDDATGADFAAPGGPWSFPEAGLPAGNDPLWRAETTATYVPFVDAWGVGQWIYSPVADGTLVFATNDNGANVSEVPPANWTHFAYRNADGSLSDWIARNQSPTQRHHLFWAYRNFAVTNVNLHHPDDGMITAQRHFVPSQFDMDSYDRLEFRWRGYEGNDLRYESELAVINEPSIIQVVQSGYAFDDGPGADRALYRGPRMVRLIFGGEALLASAAVFDSHPDQVDTGIAQNLVNIPGGVTWVNGAVIDMKFRSNNLRGAFGQTVDTILIHQGSFGIGRLDMWGVRL